MLDGYFNDIFNDQKVSEDKRNSLRKFYDETFIKAFEKGVKERGELTFDTTDISNLLKEDIARFSVFKEQSFNDTLLEMLHSSGKLPTRDEFTKQALKIDKTYNELHLETEFDQIAANAQSALQYEDYGTRTHLYPNIRFTTVHDDRTRAAHLQYDGLVLPYDHQFCKTNLPPWDWGCRCGFEQTDDEVDDKNIDPNNINSKPGFGNNPAVSGKVFSDDHPYYDLPEKSKKEAEKNLKAFQNEKKVPPLLDDYEKQLDVKVDREMFSLLKKDTPLHLTNPKGFEKLGSGAYYHPDANFVKIPVDARRKNSKWYAKAVVHHEYGHAIDAQNGIRTNKKFLKLFKESRELHDIDHYKKVYDKATLGWFDSADFDRDKNEKYGAVIDTIASMHKDINSMQTHSNAYWKRKGMQETEFIAHLFENKFAGNDVFEELLPELYEKMKSFDLTAL